MFVNLLPSWSLCKHFLADGGDWQAGGGGVCSKDASSAFILGKRASAIVAMPVGTQPGNGRGGKPRKNTGRQRRANRSGTAKAGATAGASKAGDQQSQKQFTRLRGSSLRNIFFDRSCDRPGCYVGFERGRRSPLQRFCSHDCRRALERVREREQRWKQARDLSRRY